MEISSMRWTGMNYDACRHLCYSILFTFGNTNATTISLYASTKRRDSIHRYTNANVANHGDFFNLSLPP